jgi:hypothetical protein
VLALLRAPRGGGGGGRGGARPGVVLLHVFKTRKQEKLWFGTAKPPAVPLGHNYSNPGHKGST